jgi:hypothetical protein
MFVSDVMCGENSVQEIFGSVRSQKGNTIYEDILDSLMLCNISTQKCRRSL